jgi:hypothetical protein
MSDPTTSSIREALEAAIDEPTPQTSAAPAPEPASAPAGDAPAAGGQDLDALAEGQAGGGRERDEFGRFKPRQADAAAPADATAQQPPAAQPGQQPPLPTEPIQPGPKAGPRQGGERAPQAWRPDVREHWGQLPEPVRAEIHRREVEVQRTLQESAEARKGYDAVMRTIQPYEAFIRAEGSNPMQAIDNMMSTAAKLRTGTAPELAQMMAGIVQQFGTGRFGQQFLELLDQSLAGQAPKADPQQAALEQALNQRLAPLQGMLQQFQAAQQAQQERVVTQANDEVGQFLDQAEFGEDVRQEMADIMEVAHRRGQALTLQDAYQRACLVNDRVRAVLQARARNTGSQQQAQAAQRARAAAVSVTGAAPAGAMRQDPTDVRSAIEAAIAQTSR